MQPTVSNIKGLQAAPLHMHTCMSEEWATILAKIKIQSENHNLSQKKLRFVEARRISSVLENCISQMEIAATLPAVLRFNSVSSVVDKKLNKVLQEHQLLGERLEGLKQESEEEAGEASKRARLRLMRGIKDSVRDLLRLFRVHPDAITGLRAELGMEVGESEHKLIRGLKMFHSHMVERLLTTVDEELQLYKLVSSLPAHDLEHMKLLEAKLQKTDAHKKQIDAEISRKETEIKDLQDFLQGSNTHEAAMARLAERQCQPNNTASKKQTMMRQEIDQLNIQLNNVMLENRQAERLLQEKNEKVETEIEYLLHNFDDEIEEIQADLELNEIDYEREEEERKRLEKPYTVLEVEFNQIQERRWLAEEKRQREMRDLELKTKAAIFAQAWWRGYSTRKALQNKGKNTKAKKGKGKKK